MKVIECHFRWYLLVTLIQATAWGQAPVFEDLLTDSSKITGQWGSGIFSPEGYTLTWNGTYDEYNNWPRSVDYVWYDRPGVGHDGSGSVEFDVTGLFPNAGCTSNELYCMCDSQGLNPATKGNDFWLSPYYNLLRKWPDNRMKLVGQAGGIDYGKASNYLSWDGATTYRFRVTWSGTAMRIYRGLPNETLTLLAPTPYDFGVPWAPQILHIQVGATFMSGPRNIKECGGAPGTVYSLLRIYEEDIGNMATPPRIIPTEISIDLGTTDVEEYLRRVTNGDGNTVAVNIGGRDARRTVNPASDYYIYFDANNAFAYQGSKPDLYILINYYDEGSGALTLQYDSSDPGGSPHPYYKIGGSVPLTGTNTWKQHVYHVTDAYFGNRQNNGADFRIAKDGGGYLYLDIVRVSGSPDQAGEPDPQNGATGVNRLAAELSWAEADGADSYDVYFGTNQTAVTNADRNSPEFKGNQSETMYDLGIMAPMTDHFWRIDTVNDFSITTGSVWTFTTCSYPGDFDEDLDVDIEDFGLFQACLSGTGIYATPECEYAKLDTDEDVDVDDFDIFMTCMRGPNKSPGC